MSRSLADELSLREQQLKVRARVRDPVDKYNPTPLQAWRQAVDDVRLERPVKRALGKLRMAGEDDTFPDFSYAGTQLSEFEVRIVANSLKQALVVPVYRCALRALDLGNCDIDFGRAWWLAKGLAGNATLESLNLRGNPLCSEGLEAVMHGLLAGLRLLPDFPPDVDDNKPFDDMMASKGQPSKRSGRHGDRTSEVRPGQTIAFDAFGRPVLLTALSTGGAAAPGGGSRGGSRQRAQAAPVPVDPLVLDRARQAAVSPYITTRAKGSVQAGAAISTPQTAGGTKPPSTAQGLGLGLLEPLPMRAEGGDVYSWELQSQGTLAGAGGSPNRRLGQVVPAMEADGDDVVLQDSGRGRGREAPPSSAPTAQRPGSSGVSRRPPRLGNVDNLTGPADQLAVVTVGAAAEGVRGSALLGVPAPHMDDIAAARKGIPPTGGAGGETPSRRASRPGSSAMKGSRASDAHGAGVGVDGRVSFVDLQVAGAASDETVQASGGHESAGSAEEEMGDVGGEEERERGTGEAAARAVVDAHATLISTTGHHTDALGRRFVIEPHPSEVRVGIDLPDPSKGGYTAERRERAVQKQMDALTAQLGLEEDSGPIGTARLSRTDLASPLAQAVSARSGPAVLDSQGRLVENAVQVKPLVGPRGVIGEVVPLGDTRASDAARNAGDRRQSVTSVAGRQFVTAAVAAPASGGSDGGSTYAELRAAGWGQAGGSVETAAEPAGPPRATSRLRYLNVSNTHAALSASAVSAAFRFSDVDKYGELRRHVADLHVPAAARPVHRSSLRLYPPPPSPPPSLTAQTTGGCPPSVSTSPTPPVGCPT